MKKTLIIAAIFYLFICVHAYAVDGKIITTIDYALPEKWYNTNSESIVKVNSTKTVFREQKFILTIMLTDYSVDADGKANMIYDIEITRPDGKIYETIKDITAIGKKKVNPRLILLSENNLKVFFESDKPLGQYDIKVTMKDLVNKEEKQLTGKIELTKYNSDTGIDSADKLDNWMQGYHLSPSPEKAIHAYLFYANSEASEKESSFAPVFTYFLHVINNNKYLLPHIVSIYPEQNLKTKIYLLYLLRYADYDAADFFSKLEGKEKEVYEGIKDKPYGRNPYDTIENASQLDMLWGEFFATGSIKPILRLIHVLEYRKYSGSLKKYKTLEDPAPQDRKKAEYELIFQAAIWSLKGNCSQHELVHRYCIHVLQHGKLNDDAKSTLRYILSKVEEKKKPDTP